MLREISHSETQNCIGTNTSSHLVYIKIEEPMNLTNKKCYAIALVGIKLCKPKQKKYGGTTCYKSVRDVSDLCPDVIQEKNSLFLLKMWHMPLGPFAEESCPVTMLVVPSE